MGRIRSAEYKEYQRKYHQERYQNDPKYRQEKRHRNNERYEKTKCLEGRYHGMKDTGAWKAWHSMRSRVLCPSACGYEAYKVFLIDPRWDNFMRFYEDMGDRPASKSLDRKDNNKGYSKENCRWATPKQQARNKRTVKLSLEKVEIIKTLFGKIPLSRIAKQYSVHIATISDIKQGRTWLPEVANA